jgi:hypothetical protein
VGWCRSRPRCRQLVRTDRQPPDSPEVIEIWFADT